MASYLKIISLISGLMLSCQPLLASPVGTRLNKVYKELVIQGERPEISSCMALALKSSRENGPYEQIFYSAQTQDIALAQEALTDGHLIKIVIVRAKGEPRQRGFYVNNPLQNIEIVCSQVDEGIPVVQFKSLANE